MSAILFFLSFLESIVTLAIFGRLGIPLSSKYGKSRVVFEINSARFDQSAFRNFSACIISVVIIVSVNLVIRVF